MTDTGTDRSIEGLSGLKDPQVLDFTAVEGRILVSHDQRTVPRHFARLIVTG